MKKIKRVIVFNNNYNRTAYKIGTRISKAQIAHRIGFYDDKSGILFHDQKLDGDTWLMLVNRVKSVLKLSPKDAALYVNKIYKTKLKHTEEDYFSYLNQLSYTCGKLFSVVPTNW